MPATLLADRSVVSVSGAEARDFLQGLVTCDMSKVTPDAPAFGALLTPQGKILFDFLVVERDGRFLFDVPRTLAADFAKRLGFYKLRAKVEIADLSREDSGEDPLAVVALFGAGAPAPSPDAIAYVDPRAPNMGQRIILPARAARVLATQDTTVYDAHRIACGVPQGGVDFFYGDAFPHETNMDLLHGVAFDKGCYVGQEVVSRMQHRGLARKRIVNVEIEGAAPAGTELRAGETAIGALGGAIGGHGLALVRLDRLDDLAGAPLTAGSARIVVAPRG